MSQEVRQAELQEKTRKLLDGPLSHVRAAGLAAALLPLAAVAITATSPEACSSAGVCGFVFDDLNHNGIQDAGEPGIEGAVVTLGDRVTGTDEFGFFEFPVKTGTYEISVSIPPGMHASPSNAGNDDALDSDGVPDNFGNSVGTVVLSEDETWDTGTDFGFFTPSTAPPPGTGTPGYWKNHPEAWPQDTIVVGGVSYTKAEAIAILNQVGKDKTITMFSSLVPAMLNVMVGNDSSCVQTTIDAANAWMATSGPVGSGVHAASVAWKLGEPLHRHLDNYNNGGLCAPHRE
jgi:hypothetical protein